MISRLAPICAAWALVGGALLLLIMAVTSLNAAAFTADRIAALSGGNVSGLPGYEDFVRLAVSCAALMMFPYCQLKRGHLAVDVFTRNAPAKMGRALDRLWFALTVALALFLLVFMARGLLETRADNVMSPILGWPEWPFYGPGIVSLARWAVVAAAQTVQPNHD